ncbi:glycoside hydrolase family 99-like domain-containing protein [Desulfobacterota bacterium M19]
MEGIPPVPLIKIKGTLKKFAQGIRFQHHDSPLVSIIIPVYNQIEYTLCCLKSIAVQPQEITYEVIVVDDCSSDRTPELLKKISGLILIRNSRNLNFLKSANHGASKARGRFIFFLNNDTQVLGKWLQPMVEIFKKHKDTGMVGAKIVYPSGHLQEAGNRIGLHGNSVMIGLNDDPSAPRYNYLREVDYCSGVAIMVETRLFNELNGFDELYAPCYYEDADLAYRIRKTNRKIFYQPAALICHHLSVSTNDPNDTKIKNIRKNRQKFLRRWKNELIEAHKVRLIAFYLPQFHTITENDKWWGRGFTEWTNVKKAKPNFKDHCQPKEPDEKLGYYDLRDDKVRAKQIELARKYGISAFCYYYYWFNGKKLLETPLEMLTTNKSLDFPFCICWANEDWTRTWDGESAHILMKQEYSTQSCKKFIADIFPLFADKRYVRINGRPILLLYRAQKLDYRTALEIWRGYCREQGEDVYIISVDSFGEASHYNHNHLGFDAIVEFPPHAFACQYEGDIRLLNDNFNGQLYDYKLTSRNFINRELPSGKFFRCAMPSWDNTARRQDNSHIFVNSSPENYREWLTENIEYTRNFFTGEEKLTFINAWNEWGEGNYIEPDTIHKFDYLKATLDSGRCA